jgi:hypothetical protein
MPYIANHEQEYGGKLYQKGDVMPLKYDEAQELLKHRAVAVQRITPQAKPAVTKSPSAKKTVDKAVADQ